jgi:hypothetical protein
MSKSKQSVLIIALGMIIILLVCCFVAMFCNIEPLDTFTDASIHYVSLVDFNNEFHSDLVTLPGSLAAVGCKENKWVVYATDATHVVKNSRLNILMMFLTELDIASIADNQLKPLYFIFNVCDGHREYIPFNNQNVWSYRRPSLYEYEGEEKLKEASIVIPVFHKNPIVFAWAAHRNDPSVLLIPDAYYIENHGYTQLKNEIDGAFVDWSMKQNIAVYRGGFTDTAYNFEAYHPALQESPRRRMHRISQHIPQLINVSDQYMSKGDMLHFKYIVDVDGMTNTWDGTFWKLYSGSVLIKQRSIWKQWYYADLQEWVHYVPFENDLHDLSDAIKWCQEHDEECRLIATRARQFVLDKLSWDTTYHVMRKTIMHYYIDHVNKD